MLKEFPFIPVEVTPMPQKLFYESVTAEPEKVKFPVSRQDCAGSGEIAAQCVFDTRRLAHLHPDVGKSAAFNLLSKAC